ncbi:MAG: hypothetical protein ACRBB3_09010 [Alphaproteobacteria bacterium]
MNNIWTYVGVALLGWVGYDLYAGYTLLWDIIYRETDPVSYWIVLAIWFALAVSCFFSWGEE